MIKGVNKLIVEVSNPDSEFFEKAILFVKPQMKDTPTTKLNKSADDFMLNISEHRRKPKLLRGAVFAGAIGLGAAITAVLVYFL